MEIIEISMTVFKKYYINVCMLYIIHTHNKVIDEMGKVYAPLRA